MIPEAPQYLYWLTKSEAAKALGCSTKTIEKLAGEKKIQRADRRSPAGAMVAVYHPEDVHREAEARNPKPEAFEVPPETQKAVVRRDLLEFPPLSVPEQIIAALTLFRRDSENSQKPSVRLAEKLYLTLAEAAEYSGLPPVEIRRAIEGGLVLARRTGRGWRVNRKSLETM